MKPIWFPLFIAIGIAIDAFVIWHNWGWWRPTSYETFWERLLFGLFFFGVLGVLFLYVGLFGAAAGLSSFCGYHSEHVWKRDWSARLASLRSADGIYGKLSGNVFVMSGQIGSTEVYYYYEDRGNGVYKPHKWRVGNDVTVIEEDRTDGEVVQFARLFKNESAHWWGWESGDLLMEFHIPKGSLVHQYKLQ